ncbi:MAG: cysteine desulfurase family protein [archaeon]
MKNMEVYLDNGSTTKTDAEVLEKMKPYFLEKYGNPASLHKKGKEAKTVINKSKRTIADTLNAGKKEIIFTSGGTESDNLALKGTVYANRDKGKHIITTKIEHDAVLKSTKWLEKQGFKVTYLDVDEEGFIDQEQLKEEINEETILVSTIHGNNEIGTIQDLKTLAEITHDYGENTYFHTDACQSYTKTEIDVEKQDLDLLTINSHKIHGPKGIGALYIKKGVKIQPWQHGGGHERGMRSGTLNVHGAVGFAEAAKRNYEDREENIDKMTELRDKLIKEILKIKNTKLNGPKGEKRLSNNINICFDNIEGEALAGYLNRKGIYASTGSACSSLELEPSHVLTAIGLTAQEANSSLRMTTSKYTTQKEIEYVIKELPDIVKRLRDMSPL